MKKRVLALFLAACVAFTAIPVNVYANETQTTEVQTDLETMESETLYANDTQREGDFSYKVSSVDHSVTIMEYHGTSPDVVIPSTLGGYEVVRVSGVVFNDNDEIETVTISEGIAVINPGAFRDCDALHTVIIPDSVIRIENEAFRGCDSLKTITMPKVEELGYGVFMECTSLTDIVIPKTLQVLATAGGYPFEGSGLTTVTFEEGIVRILDNICRNSDQLTTINIPSSVVEIGNNAFDECDALTTLVLPENVKKIGDCAFKNCKKLESLSLGSVEELGVWAFADCKALTSIEIPLTLTNVSGYAVFGGSGLTEVTFAEGTTKIQDYLLNNCDELTEFVVPDGITEIGTRAFYDCDQLASVKLSDTVTKIGHSAFYGCEKLGYVEMSNVLEELEGNAFFNCTLLSSIEIPLTLTNISDEAVFGGSGITTLHFASGIEKIPDYLLMDCDALTFIAIPETVKEIGIKAFYDCDNLEMVTMSDAVMKIDDDAFHGCEKLSTIELPDALTEIGSRAFRDCTSLTALNIPAGLIMAGSDASFWNSGLTTVSFEYGLEVIPENLFNGCALLTSVEIPASVTEIGVAAFKSAGLTDIAIPSNVTVIGDRAFFNCDQLVTVALSDGLKKIGVQAFDDCAVLETVIMSNTVEEFGDHAFRDCPSLTSIDIPLSLSTVGVQGVFSGTSITEIRFAEGTTKIPDNLFQLCTSLKSITIPEGITEIGRYAFSECDGLITLNMSDDVTKIDIGAFEGCDQLATVNLSKGLQELGDYAFRGCVSLTEIEMPKNLMSVGYGGVFMTTGLTTVTFEEGVTEIVDYLLRGCSMQLSRIEIPYTVTRIGDKAFEQARKLKEVYIPATVVEFGEDVFKSLTGVTFYGRPGSPAETYARQNGFSFVPYTKPAEDILFTETDITIKTLETYHVGFKVVPHTFIDDMVWSSSDESVATVDSTGMITALKAGTATITLRIGEVSESCVVTVLQDVLGLQLSDEEKELNLNESYLLVVEVLPEDASNKELSWTSSDETVVLVDQMGMITAVGNGEADVIATTTDGTNISAICKVSVPYHISYELNGGSNNESNPEKYINETVVLSDPVKLGYTFEGWFTEPEFVNQVTELSAGDYTLYAKWRANIYKIVYDENGGTSGTMSPSDVVYDVSVNLKINAYKKTGYTFIGWNTEKDGSGISYKNKATVSNLSPEDAGTIVLYAQWKANTYKIIYGKNGATDGIMKETTATYDKSTTLRTNAFARKGYTFIGWNTEKDGSGKSYKDKASVVNLATKDGETVVLFAQWKANSYKIVYGKNGATSGTMKETSATYNKSVALRNNTFKKKGYTFVGWNTEKDGSGKSYKNGASVKNLTAKDGKTVVLFAQWKANNYRILYGKNGADSGSMNPTSTIYDKTVKLSSNKFKRKGYVFTGWNTEKNGSGKAYKNGQYVKNLVDVDGKSITLYAQWKKETYSIKYVMNGGTNVKGNPTTYTVTSTIDLKKPSRKGYTFVGWYTDKNYKKKVSQIKKGSTGDVTLYAKWKKK